MQIANSVESPVGRGAAVRVRRAASVVAAIARGSAVAAFALLSLSRCLARLGAGRLTGRSGAANTIVAEEMAAFARRVGGAWIKICQILATRRDVFSEDGAAILRGLHDRVGGQASLSTRGLRDALGPEADLIVDFDPEPIASGSIAYVHKARLARTGQPVILKFRRAGVQKLISADLQLLRAFARMGSRLLPGLRHIPLEAMAASLSNGIGAQTDFSIEAQNLRRFQRNFLNDPLIRFPDVIGLGCNEQLLLLSYEPNLIRIEEELQGLPDSQVYYRRIMEQIYTMIFVHGFFHCDVHPGNIFARLGGEIVYLDCGLATQISEAERDDFADFFLCVALNRGTRAAELLLRKAIAVPSGLNRRAYTRDIAAVVDEVAGVTARGFSVAKFVAAMFDVNRRYSIVGTPEFIWMITVLLTIEGPIRAGWPDMDFQSIAIDVITAARRSPID